MAFKEDIRDLARRTQEELNESHDYFTFTKRVWWYFIKKGTAFGFRRVGGQGLLKRRPLYVVDYLTSFSFQHFVSLFEDFFFDLLRLWLAAYPASLSRKQLDLGSVLKAADKDAIILSVVDKELNELKYERVADWFAYLERLVKLGCPTTDEIDSLAEIKASRDILVHNKGIVNATYILKAAGRGRYRDGEKLEVPGPYHRQSWEMIKKVVQDISEAAIQKA